MKSKIEPQDPLFLPTDKAIDPLLVNTFLDGLPNLPQLITDTTILNRWIIYLNRAQRARVYEALKDTFLDLFKSPQDLVIACKNTTHAQQTEIFERIQPVLDNLLNQPCDLSKLITDTIILNPWIIHLNETQRAKLYEALMDTFSSLFKSPKDLINACKNTTPEQKNEICERVQHLFHQRTNETDFIDLFGCLTAKYQCELYKNWYGFKSLSINQDPLLPALNRLNEAQIIDLNKVLNFIAHFKNVRNFNRALLALEPMQQSTVYEVFKAEFSKSTTGLFLFINCVDHFADFIEGLPSKLRNESYELLKNKLVSFARCFSELKLLFMLLTANQISEICDLLGNRFYLRIFDAENVVNLFQALSAKGPEYCDAILDKVALSPSSLIQQLNDIFLLYDICEQHKQHPLKTILSDYLSDKWHLWIKHGEDYLQIINYLDVKNQAILITSCKRYFSIHSMADFLTFFFTPKSSQNSSNIQKTRGNLLTSYFPELLTAENMVYALSSANSRLNSSSTHHFVTILFQIKQHSVDSFYKTEALKLFNDLCHISIDIRSCTSSFYQQCYQVLATAKKSLERIQKNTHVFFLPSKPTFGASINDMEQCVRQMKQSVYVSRTLKL